VNLCQLAVHLVYPIGGERMWSAQGLGHSGLILAPLTAGRGSHPLGLSLSGGEVHHQEPLCLVCGLVPRQHVRLNHGSGLLVGEIGSAWCLQPPVMGMTSLEREAGFWP
jgi:hypothetical protein